MALMFVTPSGLSLQPHCTPRLVPVASSLKQGQPVTPASDANRTSYPPHLQLLLVEHAHPLRLDQVVQAAAGREGGCGCGEKRTV